MTGKRGDFDPVEAPLTPPSDNPLLVYVQPPPGLRLLAVGQALLGLLLLFVGHGLASTAGAGTAVWLAAMVPGLLFVASAAGLGLRHGWGWWLTCTIYYCTFFNMPARLVLWTLGRDEFPMVAHLVLFGFATFVLAYLNRAELLRFVRFGTPDGRPNRWMRASPAAAGLLAATVLAVASGIRAAGG